MAKIQQFKNKPTPYSFGQYYYENNDVNNFQPLEESNGIPLSADKFSNKSLHSTVTTDYQRDYIVENKLRFVGFSGIQINELTVKENSTNNKHINCDFRGFICDRNTFDCFNNDGELKAYRTIHKFFRTDSEDENNKETCQFFRGPNSNISDNGAPNFDFLTDKYIIKNLNPDVTDELRLQVGDYLEEEEGDINFGIQNILDAGSAIYSGVFLDGVNPNLIPFKPLDTIEDSDNRLTSIFSEKDDPDYQNYIQIVIWLKSNNGSGRSRKRRYYVLKVNPNELMNLEGAIATPGELANVPIVVSHDDGLSVREGHNTLDNDDCDKPAWYITKLVVTFNVENGANIELFPIEDQQLARLVKVRNPIKESNFDLDFTTINLLQEPFTSATGDVLWRKDFTPFAQVTINGRMDKNLQGYKTNDLDKQICSSPTTVRLKVDVAKYNQGEGDNQIFIEKGYPNNISPHYKVCVVHWNDIDDDFETIEDVFNNKPTNFNEIITAQDANTFIFKDYTETLNHNYTTPGIKKIKILIFNNVGYNNNTWTDNYSNYQMPPFNEIEPIRYKLLTSRIFLDIPISEFEDFGEVGGSEYKTIPWPYTTPIIGGVSENSKYSKSINDILGGGKIGDTDIIDERNLLEAKENDELGKNIEQMDLEQLRYFNKSYDINLLLGIPIAPLTAYDNQFLEDEHLLTLSFPEYFEEFDVTANGNISTQDANFWETYYARPDIANKVIEILEDIQEWNELVNSQLMVGTMKVQHPDNADYEGYWFQAQYWNGELGTCTSNNNEFGEWDVLFPPGYYDSSTEMGFPFGTERLPEDACDVYFPEFCQNRSCTVVEVPECNSNFNAGTNVAYDCMSFPPDPTPPSLDTGEEVNFDNYYNTEYFDSAYIVGDGFISYNTPNFNLSNLPNLSYTADIEWPGPDLDINTLNIPPEISAIFGLNTAAVFYDAGFWVGSLLKLVTGNTYQFQLNVDSIYWNLLPGVEGMYWDGDSISTSFSKETSVGQIFISDNLDLDLKQSCKLELNTGELTGKSIYDSSGNSNKGLLIGDYKVKKTRKGEPMRRDSFIKVPKKNGNKDGAL